jgi:hypothetical protein
MAIHVQQESVLRITLPTEEDASLFILEGRLAGAWVKELMRVTSQLDPRTDCVFDIENVLYVDPLGEEVLLWLNTLGATFIATNPYGKDLCRRLHLRRIATAKSTLQNANKQKSAKTPPGTP